MSSPRSAVGLQRRFFNPGTVIFPTTVFVSSDIVGQIFRHDDSRPSQTPMGTTVANRETQMLLRGLG